MVRTPVDSSNIKSIGYDARSQTLEVEFNSGGIYHYLRVPPTVHRELMDAESKGGFLASEIKGTYAYKKVK